MGKTGGSVQASPFTTLVAGGSAGMFEALLCHPLDTIKVNMQLAQKTSKHGVIGTVTSLARRSPWAFYKGFGPVFTGIIPKMGVRFTSFEAYKSMLANTRFANPADGKLNSQGTFLAGLAAGITEAVTIVTPMEVLKVRLQAENPSTGPGQAPKYRNAAQAAYLVAKEEGPLALFNGLSLTAIRQATNVSVNLLTYTNLKEALYKFQPQYEGMDLPSTQTALCGLVAGAAGPISNAPIDTLKTIVQRSPTPPGQSSLTHTVSVARNLFQQEGYRALYKGITPRIMRIAPGQAITYTIYEAVKAKLSAQ